MTDLLGRTDLTQANIGFLNDVFNFVRRHDLRHRTGDAKASRQIDVANVVHTTSSYRPYCND